MSCRSSFCLSNQKIMVLRFIVLIIVDNCANHKRTLLCEWKIRNSPANPNKFRRTEDFLAASNKRNFISLRSGSLANHRHNSQFTSAIEGPDYYYSAATLLWVSWSGNRILSNCLIVAKGLPAPWMGMVLISSGRVAVREAPTEFPLQILQSSRIIVVSWLQFPRIE